MLHYLLYKMALAVIYRLPRSFAYAFAEFVSTLQFRFSRKDREAVVHNLQQILLTKEDVASEAKKVFTNFGRYLVDFFLMRRTLTEDFLKENIRVVGQENLRKAVERGRGTIVVTAHLGNWEMGAALLSRMGHPVTAIALPHAEKRINRLFNAQREYQGVTIVPTSVAVRRCMEALRKNKVVALLGDRDFGRFGETLSFFGRPTLIPKGAAFFAQRTGAAILPSFAMPERDGRFSLVIEDPVFPDDDALDEHEEILRLMKGYVKVIEQKIRENPTQWLMFREFGVEFENLYPHSGV